jgi:hypothetical protein
MVPKGWSAATAATAAAVLQQGLCIQAYDKLFWAMLSDHKAAGCKAAGDQLPDAVLLFHTRKAPPFVADGFGQEETSRTSFDRVLS